jgi:hypothetical protein
MTGHATRAASYEDRLSPRLDQGRGANHGDRNPLRRHEPAPLVQDARYLIADPCAATYSHSRPAAPRSGGGMRLR